MDASRQRKQPQLRDGKSDDKNVIPESSSCNISSPKRRRGIGLSDEQVIEFFKTGLPLKDGAKKLHVSTETLRQREDEMHLNRMRRKHTPDLDRTYADEELIERLSKGLMVEQDIVDIKLDSGPLTATELKQMIGLASYDNETRKDVVRSGDITERVLLAALRNSNLVVKTLAAQSPNATMKVLELAMMDINFMVRRDAVMNPKATKKIIDIGMKDHDPSVRNAALSRRRGT